MIATRIARGEVAICRHVARRWPKVRRMRTAYRLSFQAVNSKTHREAALIARKDGLAMAWQPLDVAAMATEASLALVPEEPIRCRLVDIEGRPAAGLRLTFQTVLEKSQLDKSANEITRRQLLDFPCGADVPAAWLPSVTSDAEGRCEIGGVTGRQGMCLATDGNQRVSPQSILLNTGVPSNAASADATYRSLVKNVAPGEEAILPLSPAQWFEGDITFEDTGGPRPCPLDDLGQPAGNGRFHVHAGRPGRCRRPLPHLPLPGRSFRPECLPTRRHALPGSSNGIAPGDCLARWRHRETGRCQTAAGSPRARNGRGRGEPAPPVVGAAVQYRPKAANNPNVTDNILTDWQSVQLSHEQGKFEIVVLPGPGRVVVNGPQEKYIFKQVSAGEFYQGQPGGQRMYVHAVESH